jgi:hypothetical protein
MKMAIRYQIIMLKQICYGNHIKKDREKSEFTAISHDLTNLLTVHPNLSAFKETFSKEEIEFVIRSLPLDK